MERRKKIYKLWMRIVYTVYWALNIVAEKERFKRCYDIDSHLFWMFFTPFSTAWVIISWMVWNKWVFGTLNEIRRSKFPRVSGKRIGRNKNENNRSIFIFDIHLLISKTKKNQWLTVWSGLIVCFFVFFSVFVLSINLYCIV